MSASDHASKRNSAEEIIGSIASQQGPPATARLAARNAWKRGVAGDIADFREAWTASGEGYNYEAGRDAVQALGDAFAAEWARVCDPPAAAAVVTAAASAVAAASEPVTTLALRSPARPSAHAPGVAPSAAAPGAPPPRWPMRLAGILPAAVAFAPRSAPYKLGSDRFVAILLTDEAGAPGSTAATVKIGSVGPSSYLAARVVFAPAPKKNKDGTPNMGADETLGMTLTVPEGDAVGGDNLAAHATRVLPAIQAADDELGGRTPQPGGRAYKPGARWGPVFGPAREAHAWTDPVTGVVRGGGVNDRQLEVRLPGWMADVTGVVTKPKRGGGDWFAGVTTRRRVWDPAAKAIVPPYPVGGPPPTAIFKYMGVNPVTGGRVLQRWYWGVDAAGGAARYLFTPADIGHGAEVEVVARVRVNVRAPAAPGPDGTVPSDSRNRILLTAESIVFGEAPPAGVAAVPAGFEIAEPELDAPPGAPASPPPRAAPAFAAASTPLTRAQENAALATVTANRAPMAAFLTAAANELSLAETGRPLGSRALSGIEAWDVNKRGAIPAGALPLGSGAATPAPRGRPVVLAAPPGVLRHGGKKRARVSTAEEDAGEADDGAAADAREPQPVPRRAVSFEEGWNAEDEEAAAEGDM